MEQYELMRHLVRCLESLGIQYIITGSMASMAYGEPRFTNDVDIVADIKEDHIEGLKKCFPEGEFYLSGDAIKRAIMHHGQFNIIHPATGFKIDVVIRKDGAFDNSRFSRFKTFKITDDTKANFAAPEDVIIKKMEYYKKGGSDKHLRDIRGMLKISDQPVDYDYIGQWAVKLDLRDVLEIILKRVKED